MAMSRIDETEGRGLFGRAAEHYDRARPAYPESLYSLMLEQGALFSGAAALDVGAGNGLATRRLIELGADPVTAIEPDVRFRALLMWHVFQNLAKDDDFHEATTHLLGHLAESPSGAPDRLPFPLDRHAREAEFTGTGQFELSAFLEIRWTLVLNTDQVRSLYQGFSSIARLPDMDRAALLNQITEVSDVRFGGVVTRNMISPMYIFRRTR
jgi:SAM-dependent methyltransferase